MLPKSTSQAVMACAAFGLHYWADAPSTGVTARRVPAPSPVVWGLDEKTRSFVPVRIDRKTDRAAIVGMYTDGRIVRYERSQLRWVMIVPAHAEETLFAHTVEEIAA